MHTRQSSCLFPSVYPLSPSITGGVAEVRPRWGPAFPFSDAHAGISGALFQERESGEGPLRRRGGQKGVGAHRTGRQMSAVTSTSQDGGHSRGKRGIEVSSRASTSPGKSWRRQGTAWSSAWGRRARCPRSRAPLSGGPSASPVSPSLPWPLGRPAHANRVAPESEQARPGRRWGSPTGG